MTSEVTHLWACNKLFLESDFQHKENKQILAKSGGFSRQQQINKI